MTKRSDGFTFVPQYEHGALAGELARRWGNERFTPVALAEALEVAATHHDDGWRELDDLPAYNREAGRPAHLLELSLERTIPPFGRGVDRVYAIHKLAGALVSMHWAGLYSSQWGLGGGGPVPHPLAEAVVAEQERRRQDALLECWGFVGLRSEFEADVWHAYEVLQAVDLISLALSLADPAEPTSSGGEPLLLRDVLWAVEQPPGGRLLRGAPTARCGDHLELLFAIPEPEVATIEPWPFAAGDFEVTLPARVLPRATLPEEVGVAAYRAAPVHRIRWTLRAER